MIRVEQLTKYYGARVGVRDVTLEVAEGCVFGFIGPNGAGKTTVIRLLLGFLKPDVGSAKIFGLDCWRDSHVVKRDVGYVPGDLRLYPWMNARDALQITSRARGRSVIAAGRELAGYFELDLGVPVRAMSRGMRQKLGMILALAHEPRLLVLDEPTSGLDPLTQERLFRHLRTLAARGHTIFFSSHVLSEVENLCERVAIVRAGQLVEDESLLVLRGRAQRAVTIRWAGAATPGPPAPPPFLTLRESAESIWHCRLSGPVPELLNWLHGKEVADLSIGPPDLDSVFMRYYEEDA